MQSANRVINSTLGVLCTYNHKDGAVTDDVEIIIDRNILVKDEFNVLAGYRVQGNFTKEQIPQIEIDDKFTDESGQVWSVTELTEETTTKWYVNIIEVY